jgi:hypothetical protein
VGGPGLAARVDQGHASFQVSPLRLTDDLRARLVAETVRRLALRSVPRDFL